MSALWSNAGTGWELLAPVGFPTEAILHDLIEEAPELLPLSGTPRITILGREVGLASGSADLVAVEISGQPVFIEIKLERNQEARRAVVAQVLSYAASVHGLDANAFETQVLGAHLRKRGYSSVGDAVASTDDSGLFDAETFNQTLSDCLATGTARLVLVLDSAPPELMRVAGYLEAVSARLVVDLVTVRQYDVGGQSVIVPQRVDPGREQEDRVARSTRPSTPNAQYSDGAADFISDVDDALSAGDQETKMVIEWAQELERTGLARLMSTRGTASKALRVRLTDEDGGPVTVFKAQHGVSMALWPSVLRRRSPQSVPQVEQVLAPQSLRDGGSTYPQTITQALLQALTSAYREAAAKPMTPS